MAQDPWVWGALLVLLSPILVPLAIMFGGAVLVLYGFSTGGPLGAGAIIAGAIWTGLVLSIADPGGAH